MHINGYQINDFYKFMMRIAITVPEVIIRMFDESYEVINY